MHTLREATTRAYRHKRGAFVLVLVCAGIAVAACAREPRARARVPRGSVVGRAAAGVGDSGVFASPVLPHGVRPLIPHADAESASVAMGYWEAPSVQDVMVPYPHDIPTEQRHFCGRSYYVRPVVAMPDTTIVRSQTSNDWMMWAPTWVVPICDAKGVVRSSVELADVPPGLRVIQGPNPHDVPELVPDSGTFPHIGQWPATRMEEWERGIGMSPETAVATANALLSATSIHVVEVPEAFTMVRMLKPPAVGPWRIIGDLALCPRWRLTLDRPVTLRGAVSGQEVRTATVWVTKRLSGCQGAPLLQIPNSAQPGTVPFMYDASRAPAPGSRLTRPPERDLRWTVLRVVEPIWFEEARP